MGLFGTNLISEFLAARATPSKMTVVAIQQNVHVEVGPPMSAEELELLAKWVELNRDALEGYWHGDIEWTIDAIDAVRPIETASDNT